MTFFNDLRLHGYCIDGYLFARTCMIDLGGIDF